MKIISIFELSSVANDTLTHHGNQIPTQSLHNPGIDTEGDGILRAKPSHHSTNLGEAASKTKHVKMHVKMKQIANKGHGVAALPKWGRNGSLH